MLHKIIPAEFLRWPVCCSDAETETICGVVQLDRCFHLQLCLCHHQAVFDRRRATFDGDHDGLNDFWLILFYDRQSEYSSDPVESPAASLCHLPTGSVARPNKREKNRSVSSLGNNRVYYLRVEQSLDGFSIDVRYQISRS